MDAWETARKSGFKRSGTLQRAWARLERFEEGPENRPWAVLSAGIEDRAGPILKSKKGVQALFGPTRNPRGSSASVDPAGNGNAVPLASPKASATYALGLAAEGKLDKAAEVFVSRQTSPAKSRKENRARRRTLKSRCK